MVFTSILLLAFCAVQLTISIEDFKNRQIWLWQPITTLFLCICIGVFQSSLVETFWNSILNTIWLALQLSLVYIYFFLKGDKRPFLDQKIGTGDILYLFALTPLFKFEQFLLFYLSGLVLSLASSQFLKYVRRDSRPLIPLAGFFSIWAIACGAMQVFQPDSSFFSLYSLGLFN